MSRAQLKCREEQCVADFQGLYTFVYLSKRVLWTLAPAGVLPSGRGGGGTEVWLCDVSWGSLCCSIQAPRASGGGR